MVYPLTLSPGRMITGGPLHSTVSIERNVIEVSGGSAIDASSRKRVSLGTSVLTLAANPKRRRGSSKRRVVIKVERNRVILVRPYVKGQTDEDTLILFRNDLWYTDKDYSDFLKDRIDTIRVYRSVNGDMTCLRDHYSIRGLEPYLKFNAHLELQRKQQAVVGAVLSEQRRQKNLGGLADPAAIRRQLLVYSESAQKEARVKAVEDFKQVANESSVEDDSDTESSTEEPSKIPSQRSFSLISTPVREVAGQDRLFVDLRSLRDMNRKLMEKIQSRPSPSSWASTGSDTLDEIDKELEQWKTLLSLKTCNQHQDAPNFPGMMKFEETSGGMSALLALKQHAIKHQTMSLSPLRRDSLVGLHYKSHETTNASYS